MKRCPECRRDYYDDTLSFCLNDGTELVYGLSPDEPPTAILSEASALGDGVTPSESPTRATTGQNAESKAGPQLPASKTAKQHGKFGAGNRLLLALGITLMLIIGGFFGYRYFASANSKQISSIAVLPFQNKSGDPNSEYLSDGLAESLIYRLSQLPNLKVSPTSSVIQYKGKDTKVATIANELGVEAVMTGRLAQIGDNLTISVELVDVRDNKLLWGEQYERKVSDLLAVQREIATVISDKLQLKLTGEDAKGVTKRYTDNNDAYQLYLKGRFYWNKLTPEDVRKSIGFYQQAIDKDPAFALAYVGISDAYMLLGIPDVMLGALPPQESIQKARAAADKALEIDPMLAEAYASRAHVKWKNRDWAGADEDFKHSIELNGNYSNGRRFYSIYLVCTGRPDEGIKEVRRAEELEPLSVSVKAHVALILYFARRYDEAIEAGKTAVEMDRSSPVAHQRLGSAYEQKRMFPEAITEFQKAVDDSNRVQLAVSSLAHAYAVGGNRAEAQKLLAEMQERAKTEYVSSYLIAEIYVALGEKEPAFKLLETAYAERSIDLVLAKTDPRLDPLRDDPRFQAFLKKVGFPD